MLLEFKTKNYKSFTDEISFSMIAAPKQKGLDYSLFLEKINKKKIKGLCSSVIYGPNAAGKTNVIGAMDTLRSIILRGSIKNSEEKNQANPAANELELIPNNNCNRMCPVEFFIDFIEEDIRFQYKLIIEIGTFLETNYPRKISYEELHVNEEVVFSRKYNNLSLGDLQFIEKYRINMTKLNDNSAIDIAENSLSDDELFLTNGFKLIFSQNLVKIITDWFTVKLMTICHADSMKLIHKFSDPKNRTAYINKKTNEAAKLLGANSNAIGYVYSDDSPEPKLCSLFKDDKKDKTFAIAVEMFESYGTIRFVNLFPLIIVALKTGGTLIVDEFDASIHPMALMSIINVFHNDDININHAQLIFNTHNPIFLNSNLFRRDEIKFVERDDDTHASTVYSLADFGTTGEKGVRKHEDYLKNYFISQYGAIRDIDFTPIFEEMLSEESEV